MSSQRAAAIAHANAKYNVYASFQRTSKSSMRAICNSTSPSAPRLQRTTCNPTQPRTSVSENGT